MASWHDIESARDEWIDAPLNDDVLTELLDVAKQQVIVYAPKSVRAALVLNPLVVPDNLRMAQRRHAENMWNAGRVDPSGGVGGDEFVSRPHPLDWHIKQLIRPRSAVPRVR